MSAARRCDDCDATLSRYNAGRRCQACAVDPDAAAKDLFPQDLLTDAAFSRALGDGDWQTALRQIVEATSLTQVAIAAATGVSQSYVSRLMNGQSQEPGIGTVRSLCDGLGIPRPMAGLAPAQPENTTNRRQVLGAGAGAAGLALLSA